MAGLPGTGKTTLARRLAQALDAPHLDKDRVRAALFDQRVEYSPAQNDFCCEILYRAVGWLAERGGTRYAVLDGRTYARRKQVEALRASLEPRGIRARFVRCVCRPEVARARLSAERGAHIAGDRVPELYDRLVAVQQPLDEVHHVVDTSDGVDDAAWAACLAYARG